MLTVERELSLEDGFCIKDIDSFSHQAFNVLSNTLFSAKEMKALEDNYTFKVLSDDNELMETLVTELEAFVDQALDQIEVKVYIPVADRCNQKGL
jgi:ribosome assembly protein YihI (activator of Der GTPase)